MCSSKAVEDETNLVSTTRDVVLGSIGINDLESIRLVIIELEGTVICLQEKVSESLQQDRSHEPHRDNLADQDEWLFAVD